MQSQSHGSSTLPQPRQETHKAHPPQQVQGHDHLERGRPDHVYVSSQVHESLSIHRHQIHNLTHCRSLPSRICDNKCLCVDKNEKQLKHEDTLNHLYFLHRIQVPYRTSSLEFQVIIFLLHLLFVLYTLQNASSTV